MQFYHSEKLQSTKTRGKRMKYTVQFYHSEKLQSTKTVVVLGSTYLCFIIAKN